MDFVFSARRLRRGRFGSEPGPTRFLQIPGNARDISPDHQVRKAAWVKAIMDAATGGANDPRRSGDIVVNVHGFNTETSEMLGRHRKIRKGLAAHGFKGVLVSFDWPSAGMALNYLEDRTDAKTVAIRLVDDGISTFAALQRPDCRIDLHVLAHSMGCFVVREALDDADDRPAVASHAWTISQMMLVGADVSAGSLGQGNSKSSSLYRRSVRVTNYFNPLDEVLSISAVKRIGVAPRLGRVGLPEPVHSKAANIYCGDHFRLNRDKFPPGINAGHSWYFDDAVFYHDLMLTITGGIDRNEFPTRAPTNLGGLGLRAPG